ncbi:bifunctional ADP-dependent NAD(P)H-hydrate dehydratase/NAD(P)H-hydrate epimerase [Fibrobacter sp. UWB2]|uniref:NAD(P)H-hydrate dehydratase n=1 Tax=Fibrobacter sp. UWB2 TaxID=1964358 RepID=UPI000B51EE0A|nr:NAD(P)H-hydrate dehydratase [Fibrobacter sp. UWB2]OWV21114.1 bifunctional ADP-dependent NAD(P)H-hydrate dehydratase/NAD(P)H-hydrate epimerase [Fibrobacter sp. UWB2]
MRSLLSLNLQPILSTEGMRKLDAASKEFLAKETTSEPSEKDVIQSGYTLMQEAGLALFKFVQAKALAPIAIFIGGGNNGGDGLVLAKHLLQAGIQSTVFSLAPESKFKNEAKLALDDFSQAGGSLFDFKKITEEPKQASLLLHEGFKLIVDCMLGNGAKGELRTEFATAAQIINESGLPVIAADAPTGYDSATHVRNNICIQANETMLFGFPRLDAYTKEGGPAFGKAVVAPLNYPDEVIKQFDEKNYLITENSISQLLPQRNEWGDKRNQGTAFIIAGSKDMPGAATLCTEAALRSGAGLVTLATTEAIAPIIQAKLSEPVFCSLDDFGKDSVHRGTLRHENITTLLDRAKHASAIAIGPGLSTNFGTVEAVLALLPQFKVPTVIDADALNAIAMLDDAEPRCGMVFHDEKSTIQAVNEYLRNLQQPAILTPHVREFARLFGELPNSTAIPNRLREIATSTNKVILLKGAPTYIASPDGNIYIIPVANSGMAKGGSGDVLSGIIVALLAQGLAATEAAVLGALLHQKAGRITREELGAFSMLPSDIIKNLHKAF